MNDSTFTAELLGKLLSQGPLFAAVLLSLVTGYRQTWVWGWQYTQMKEERDRYRAMLDERLRLLEAAAATAKVVQS